MCVSASQSRGEERREARADSGCMLREGTAGLITEMLQIGGMACGGVGCSRLCGDTECGAGRRLML